MTSPGVITETTLIAATDAGMHALWNPSYFTSVTDYGTWESALLDDDDITKRVRAGELVPINIGSDGVFQFLARVGTEGQAPTLTSSEKQHLLVSSQPYRYLSDGAAYLTGLEHICADPSPRTPVLAIPSGPQAVTIHLIDWAAELGGTDDTGKPPSRTLPDFVLLICPADTATTPYRTRLNTFDRG
jgi:hypothetical protein